MGGVPMRQRARRRDRSSPRAAVLSLASIAAIISIAPLLTGTVDAALLELTPATFESVVKSGRNGMIRYYQSWCGHCIRMKPDWDRLAKELEGDPANIFIADVNCGNYKEMCDIAGVTGYPTIRYYSDGKEHPYDGGRGFEMLLEFVREELMVRCSLREVAGTCSERAAKYVDKWKGREEGTIQREIQRLWGMEDGDMTPDLRGWVRERADILNQLVKAGFGEDGEISLDGDGEMTESKPRQANEL